MGNLKADWLVDKMAVTKVDSMAALMGHSMDGLWGYHWVDWRVAMMVVYLADLMADVSVAPWVVSMAALKVEKWAA